jgi:hypothetical protein
MNAETLKGMITDSTWQDRTNRTVYQFIDDNDLAINGINCYQYSVNSNNGRVLLNINPGKKYTVEYVNDFQLRLLNNNEELSLMLY